MTKPIAMRPAGLPLGLQQVLMQRATQRRPRLLRPPAAPQVPPGRPRQTRQTLRQQRLVHAHHPLARQQHAPRRGLDRGRGGRVLGRDDVAQAHLRHGPPHGVFQLRVARVAAVAAAVHPVVAAAAALAPRELGPPRRRRPVLRRPGVTRRRHRRRHVQRRQLLLLRRRHRPGTAVVVQGHEQLARAPLGAQHLQRQVLAVGLVAEELHGARRQVVRVVVARLVVPAGRLGRREERPTSSRRLAAARPAP